MWFKKTNTEPKNDTSHPDAENSVSYELADLTADNASLPRLIITAFEYSGPDVERGILSAVNVAQLDNRFPIVACTDVKTEFLVKARMPIELLPKAQDLHGLSKVEFEQYLTRRWELILGKWEVTEVMDLALSFDGFLHQQLDNISSQ